MSPRKLVLAVAVTCSLHGMAVGDEWANATVQRPDAAAQRPGAARPGAAVRPPSAAAQRPNRAKRPNAAAQRPNAVIQRRNKTAQQAVAALPRPHAAALRPESANPRPRAKALLPDAPAQRPAPRRPDAAASQLATGGVRRANFVRETPARAARTIADWVVTSKDNRGAAFFIVDKARARLYVFNPAGRLQGASPILLGLARGDDSVPGIGDKPLAEIHTSERTTPAGRFVAQRGRNLKGEDIVWVDYAAAVSLHRVREVNPGEHRVQRLKTKTVADNRISYGCINVPVWFYNQIVQRAWRSGSVVVYVLPEQRPLETVFPRHPSFEVASSLVRRSG